MTLIMKEGYDSERSRRDHRALLAGGSNRLCGALRSIRGGHLPAVLQPAAQPRGRRGRDAGVVRLRLQESAPLRRGAGVVQDVAVHDCDLPLPQPVPARAPGADRPGAVVADRAARAEIGDAGSGVRAADGAGSGRGGADDAHAAPARSGCAALRSRADLPRDRRGDGLPAKDRRKPGASGARDAARACYKDRVCWKS